MKKLFCSAIIVTLLLAMALGIAACGGGYRITVREGDEDLVTDVRKRAEAGETVYSEQEKAARIEILKEQMQQAARELEFEEAAKLRDEIKKLMGEAVTASKAVRPGMVGSAKKSRGRSRK